MLLAEIFTELLNHPLAYPASSSTAAPGPTGNACDIPREHSWITYRDSSTEYGIDVVVARVSDDTLIVLNSYTAATDLLEKRSSIYSNRPVLVLAEPGGWIRTFGLKPTEMTGATAVVYSGNTSSLVLYSSSSTGSSKVKATSTILSSCRSVCKTVLTATYGILAEEIGTQYVDILHEADTSGTLFAFFCAMPVVLHPEVQQRAQLELDAVVGCDRLPEHADRPSSHYISTIAQEALAGTIPLLWVSLTGPQRRINIVAGRPEREL
ncbi:hypothetical protein ONZ51_g9392 [Trametes cubensis]|uniref:Uncharacterized protein n=1 Tax=Trametes cubensis TaxID=1111947 RepID=A0AAD7TLG6_9APHY|nr:hypothetical protein ONZ51_g9392 [Trametes cubensis]